MTHMTVVDNMIGDHAYAINLVAHPPVRTKDIFTTLQDQISNGIPSDRIYRCPENSLHMSVFQFVHSRKCRSPKQISIWNKQYEEIDALLKTLLAKSETCILESPSVLGSETAVIVEFKPTRSIELIRDRLELYVKQTDLAWNRPTIHHVTIARYIHPFPLREVVSNIEEIDLPNLSWKIDTVNLVQENVYPSLDNNLIQKYTFGLSQCHDQR